eukprot:TRINITY_DN10746_c0_g1_i1.p1 TRINITY_DN10746_c0_g1~~TRINITY_DN10746_c0_g1_i1.p1  ORF type:complete len:1710 (+),score=360.80 TRINITY_DN10746_c0_g1_i1:129-5258(+)
MAVLKIKANKLTLEKVGEWLSSDDHQRYASIDLPGKQISDDEAMLLNSLAMRCKRLQTLKLSGNLITDLGVESLADALPVFTSEITHLDLSGNRITARGAEKVTEAFIRMQVGGSSSSRARPEQWASADTLEEQWTDVVGLSLLDLSENDLNDVGVEALARHVHRRIRLRLRRVGCGKNGLRALLQRKEEFQELDLGMNSIGAVGVNGLCRAVQSCREWRDLRIHGLLRPSEETSILPEKWVAALATPLSSCVKFAPHLRHLDCGGNDLGDAGAKLIVEALAECQVGGLQSLSLGCSGCGIQTSNALQSLLSKRVSNAAYGLRFLDLDSNVINEECCAILAGGIAKNSTLLRLVLARNRINSAGARHLASGLERQRVNQNVPAGQHVPGCLAELDLSFNADLDDDGAQALSQAAMASVSDMKSKRFQAPWGLERLHLGGTCVEDMGCIALSGAVATRAALAHEAAIEISSSPDDSLLRYLREGRIRRPSGLRVFGLQMDVAPADAMRKDAESKLKELWPEPEPMAADEAAGAIQRRGSQDDEASFVAEGDLDKQQSKDQPFSPQAKQGDYRANGSSVDKNNSEQRNGSAVLGLNAEEKMRFGSSGMEVKGEPWGGAEVGRVGHDRGVGGGTGGGDPGIFRFDFGESRIGDEALVGLRQSQDDGGGGGGVGAGGGAGAAGGAGGGGAGGGVSAETAGGFSPTRGGGGADAGGGGAAGQSLQQDCTQHASEQWELESSGPSTAPAAKSQGKGPPPPAPGGKGKSKGPGPPPAGKAASCEGQEGADVQATEAKVPAKGGGKGKMKGPGPPPSKAAPGRGPEDAAVEVSEAKVPAKGGGKGKVKGPGPPPSKAAPGEGQGDAAANPAEATVPAKGKSKGPPAPGGKGGKGPAPPDGKGTGKAPLPKGKGAAAAKPTAKQPATKAVPKYVGETPFGRRIHWTGTSYEEPSEDSVFGELQSGVEFDPHLLKLMLSGQAAEKMAGGKRRPVAKKAQGIAVLDGNRAQNMGIVMSKLNAAVSSEALCKSLQELDFEDVPLSVDDVELLIQVLPTPEESKKLLEHKEKVEELRDVEQTIMPFCLLHKSVVRLKLMKFCMSHTTSHKSLIHRCEVMQNAAWEVRNSPQFKEIMAIVLRVGNFINHGVDDVREGTVRAFAIENLASLGAFKTGAVSTLHFICLSTRSTNPDFFQAFKASLSHVHEAGRETMQLLKSAIEQFAKDVEFSKLQGANLLKPPGDGEEGQDQPSADMHLRMQTLMDELNSEKTELQKKVEEAAACCTDVQTYFLVSQKAKETLPPSEVFFGHIARFIDDLGKAWEEIEKNPKKWNQFEGSGQSSAKVQRKSLPPGQLTLDSSKADVEGRLSEPCQIEKAAPSASSDARRRRHSSAVSRRSVSFSVNPGDSSEEPSRSPSPEPMADPVQPAQAKARPKNSLPPPGKGKGKARTAAATRLPPCLECFQHAECGSDVCNDAVANIEAVEGKGTGKGGLLPLGASQGKGKAVATDIPPASTEVVPAPPEENACSSSLTSEVDAKVMSKPQPPADRLPSLCEEVPGPEAKGRNPRQDVDFSRESLLQDLGGQAAITALESAEPETGSLPPGKGDSPPPGRSKGKGKIKGPGPPPPKSVTSCPAAVPACSNFASPEEPGVMPKSPAPAQEVHSPEQSRCAGWYPPSRQNSDDRPPDACAGVELDLSRSLSACSIATASPVAADVTSSSDP